MFKRAILFVAPVLGLLFLATSGRAGMITWTADWSHSTNVALSNGGLETGGVSIATPPANTVLTGSQSTTAATLTTFTSALPGNPDLFNSVPYTLVVDLTDLNSGRIGILTFTGTLSGSLTTTTASFTNTFTSPATKSIQLLSDVYTVSLSSFFAPGPPTPAGGGSPVQGYITAQITAKPVDTITISSPTLSTPEPASLVLAGLGTSLIGLLRFRRS